MSNLRFKILCPFSIVRCFGTSSISVKRWVKKYCEEGAEAFYQIEEVIGTTSLFLRLRYIEMDYVDSL